MYQIIWLSNNFVIILNYHIVINMLELNQLMLEELNGMFQKKQVVSEFQLGPSEESGEVFRNWSTIWI